MKTDKRLLKVFLCHAHADRDSVRGLYTRLTQDGVDAWLDKAKLLPGQDWELEISSAIKVSDIVLVCLSNKSISKEGYVQKEIKFALDIADEKPEGIIYIIPARLEDCTMPSRLGRYQWVDLFEIDGYMRLIRAFNVRAEKLGIVVPPKVFINSPVSEKDLKRVEKLQLDLMDLEHNLLLATIGDNHEDKLKDFINDSNSKLSEIKEVVVFTKTIIDKVGNKY